MSPCFSAVISSSGTGTVSPAGDLSSIVALLVHNVLVGIDCQRVHVV